eukprot:TRINITY_DN2873_c0_g1_i1.p3 TRINITY_DN2873_c0_g1~~TRINITY_DN2873_c0_g1_i1.p3  ORF type:complete len:105 (+),score=24.10 TRINITY_DN2873_c0_g1_i1:47-361(+)
MAISRLAVLACLLASCIIVLQGCSSCESDGDLEVCCPSKTCKNDKGCCGDDFQGECTTQSGDAAKNAAASILARIKETLEKCPDGCKADAEKPECRLTSGDGMR